MADSVKIQVTHANFYYGGHQALFDVSVKIPIKPTSSIYAAASV
jgi:ABC-type arginine transport system ATPase subunit